MSAAYAEPLPTAMNRILMTKLRIVLSDPTFRVSHYLWASAHRLATGMPEESITDLRRESRESARLSAEVNLRPDFVRRFVRHLRCHDAESYAFFQTLPPRSGRTS